MLQTLFFGLVTLALVGLCLVIPRANLLVTRSSRRRAIGRVPLGTDRNTARNKAISVALEAALHVPSVLEVAAPRGMARDGKFRIAGGDTGTFTILREVQTDTNYVVELEAATGEETTRQSAA